ncbi:MAG: ATP-binding cassette domain-containing protein [Bacteroidales bacterium]|nr:ATP-binding cassette domain-containing protein [Bacteroidales bacterium]
MVETVIEITGVSKTYEGNKLAVDNVSLSVAEGEFLTIIGPSGCGKTTLLRLVNGMTDFESGSIKVLNREMHFWDIVQLRRKIGYVIQGAGLFPHLTVKQNMQFVLNISGMAEDLQEERVIELAQIIGFSKSQLKEYPDSLSGGQQQRVGVARALAMKPQILLMDEPFGALDNITRRNLQAEMKQIHNDLNVNILMVTHDLNEAFSLGNEVVIMHNTKILQTDKPENILKAPASEWVKEFVSAFRA